MDDSPTPDDEEPVRLGRPLACWHESRVSARTDRMVALSAAGGVIETDRPLPTGTEIFLELHLGHASNAARAEIDAVVDEPHENSKTGFSVRFLEVDDAVQTWIKRHIGVEPVTPVAEAAKAKAERKVPSGFQLPPSLEDGDPIEDDGGFTPGLRTLEYVDEAEPKTSEGAAAVPDPAPAPAGTPANPGPAPVSPSSAKPDESPPRPTPAAPVPAAPAPVPAAVQKPATAQKPVPPTPGPAGPPASPSPAPSGTPASASRGPAPRSPASSAALFAGTMDAGPGSAPAPLDAEAGPAEGEARGRNRDTQPFGIDVAEVHQQLGKAPAAEPAPLGAGRTVTPPLGTPSLAARPEPPAVARPEPPKPGPVVPPGAKERTAPQFPAVAAAAFDPFSDEEPAPQGGPATARPGQAAPRPLPAPHPGPGPSPAWPTPASGSPAPVAPLATRAPTGAPTPPAPAPAEPAPTPAQSPAEGAARSPAEGPAPEGQEGEEDPLQLRLPDASGLSITVDLTAFDEPSEELSPFEDWAVEDSADNDELPVVMGTDSAAPRRAPSEDWFAREPSGRDPEE